MKRFMLYLILCCHAQFIYCINDKGPSKQIIKDFLSTNWPTVMVAKEKIENIGYESIPEIMAVMNDCRISKLENTGDLIYPGAEKFFGHGQIIDYDIDDLCVRAGWLVEDLTFRNFGFTGIHLPVEELAPFIRKTFPDYSSTSANRNQLDEMTESAMRKLIRTLSIEQATKWWNTAS
jgi:hypothetical protein